ncbi:MAG: putative ATPase of PP-loop superfamily [Bacteriovoracaceae bacterium]|nr:putative ATPase of PP-loop superfamily [Bacteriovoracaceae bacterium]
MNDFMNQKQVWMSWSSGKDSAFALYELQKQLNVNVAGLLTTINETHERVAMHAVRETLLIRQAEELGLPLCRIKIPYGCSNELYETKMLECMNDAIAKGVAHIAFGDLFLEDVKQYRETLLKKTSVSPLFPIWHRPTHLLAREMIAIGQKAIITCIDPKKLPISFVGREFDLAFLSELPNDVDPCGENGEFHSFIYDSPLFKKTIPVRVGQIIERDGFVFADVMES